MTDDLEAGVTPRGRCECDDWRLLKIRIFRHIFSVVFVAAEYRSNPISLTQKPVEEKETGFYYRPPAGDGSLTLR
jgi:hypothetical protein